MSERIQKVLARAGVGSRREVEAWIRAGRLSINGVPAALGAQLGPRDKVTLDGRPVRLRAPDSDTRVIIYHRTPGRNLTPGDSPDSGQFLDRLPRRAGRRWVPISPLPPNDGGLELLTSDGDLAQALMRKLSQLRIEFAIRIHGEPRPEQLERLKSGLLDDDESIAIESLEAAGGEGANRWYTLVTRGGRARDVRRLCAAAGVELSRLMRVGLGPVLMDRSLARERSRSLGLGETMELYALAGLEDPRKSPSRRRFERRTVSRASARVSRAPRNPRRKGRVTGNRNSDR
ncbi:MAG TPA: S4 domain-containing protein [Steroidobacteraceae bacterium]